MDLLTDKIYSFSGKQLTGTGARDLFTMHSDGRLVPNRRGCANLASLEAPDG